MITVLIAIFHNYLKYQHYYRLIIFVRVGLLSSTWFCLLVIFLRQSDSLLGTEIFSHSFGIGAVKWITIFYFFKIVLLILCI